MIKRKKIRLGDLLVEQNIISEAQLDEALQQQKTSGVKLGRVLIDNGHVEEDQLLRLLSDQLSVALVDLTTYPLHPDIVKIIPEIHARRFRVIALAKEGNSIVVGMADPTNIFAYDELSRILKKDIVTAVVRESDLLEALDDAYRQTGQISGFAEELKDQLSVNDHFLLDIDSLADDTDAPVVKLLQSVMDDAVKARASDIHIEPDEDVLRIRERIDGVLHENVIKEKAIASALVVRLKLMAGLDISEKRLPQDGRFSINLQNRDIDVRLSTMPTYYGESVVMRLLDQSKGITSLAELGMEESIRERYEACVQRPHGMVLVTGPTGSGKTTTLYSTLKLLNKPEVKIITVEDPVEYRLPRINQVQVNAEIELSFARVLRTILRQDPDVVLIGEMRDAETVQIGLRAAMTGHMVLSTLHTNDAVSTATRLLDLGAPGYLLATSLRAIIAQRLIRRICDSCKKTYEPTVSEMTWLKRLNADKEEYFFGKGCQKCHQSGYLGRIAVQELLVIDDELALALASEDSATFIRTAKLSKHYQTLDSVALEYASKGITSLEEVMRIAADNPFSSSNSSDSEGEVFSEPGCEKTSIHTEAVEKDPETVAARLENKELSSAEANSTEALTADLIQQKTEITSPQQSNFIDNANKSDSGLTLELVDDDASI